MSEIGRFRVTRTSVWNDEKSPCPEAVKGTYTQHCYCTLPLKEAMASPRTAWFRDLTNHRASPGGSVADRVEQPCWFIDLTGLDDLLAFCSRHGSVIVSHCSDGPAIEIYDGYRE